MASTAHKDPEMMKERFDSPKVLEKKIKKLVDYIKKSKHFIIFTGAGISTSAGIPDFRGPEGVWTLQATGGKRKKKTVSSIRAIPTATHMSIVELQKVGICKYLISQNCDGLHKRSGILPSKISELHGNGNIEECETCGKQYLRDFSCYRITRGRDHFTGRYCTVPKDKKTSLLTFSPTKKSQVCGGRLLEWTIDFGQSLPEKPLKLGWENAKKADLCLVLGSSLTVSPACNMPELVGKRQKLVICNLQKTPYYNQATLNIHAKTDEVMKEVIKRLNLTLPIWELKRKILIGNEFDGKNFKFYMKGVDFNDSRLPASIFKQLKIVFPSEYSNRIRILNKEPFVITDKPIKGKEIEIKIQIFWMGWYYEPPITIKHKIILSKEGSKNVCSLGYRPDLGKWFFHKNENLVKPLLKEGKKEEPTEIPKDEKKGRIYVKQIKFEGKILPEGRIWGASVLSYDEKGEKILVLIGGANRKKDNFPKINIFKIKNQIWVKANIKSKNNEDLPYINKARWGMSANVMADNPWKIYIIGGFDSQYQYNDVHVFNLKKNTIECLKTSGSKMSYRLIF